MTTCRYAPTGGSAAAKEASEGKSPPPRVELELNLLAGSHRLVGGNVQSYITSTYCRHYQQQHLSILGIRVWLLFSLLEISMIMSAVLMIFCWMCCALLALPSAAAARLGQHQQHAFGAEKALQSSSQLVNVQYHMGPVLTPKTHIYILWYGKWAQSDKQIIKDFLQSVSSDKPEHPSVAKWWSTVRLYTDQTGANITDSFVIAEEHEDSTYSHGKSLTRLSVQDVLKGSLEEFNGTLPARSKGGLYLILTADDVVMQDFCRAICGFHYFSFPSIVGYTLPYAWIGHSGKQCPDVCAYPFAVSPYMGDTKPMIPPNGNVGVDGMISVIGHELAEMSSNPLINAWYAGQDPRAPTEIADLCEGMYGAGAGGSYPGTVLTDRKSGAQYNMNGINGRKYLVQWLWNPVSSSCSGPNY